MYSTKEKVWWVEKCGAGYSYHQVSELFPASFPGRPKPSHTTIMRCYKKFKETGCVNVHPNVTNRPQRESANELVVLAAVNANPAASSREMERMTGVSQRTVLRVLHKHKYASYKVHLSQQLTPEDIPRRLEFASQMLEMCDADPGFVRNIIFTDESSFTLNHAPNRQNVRTWSQTNPHEVYAAHTQYPGRLNVWAGIFNHAILGPVIIDGTLTGEKYLSLLETEISERVAAVDTCAELWWMHDGCPAHNYRPAREFLQHAFPNHVIGTYEQPIAWPARAPDLNPCDTFLWGHIKSTIYRSSRGAPYPNLQALQCAIEECCANITHTQLAAVQQNFEDRLRHVIVAEGKLFEHLL